MASTSAAGAATTTAASQTGSSKAMSSLSTNFDNFLLLLTKQLQNQDPLSPLDTNEFTSQLVQFTSVEQQIAQNQKLDKLISLQNNNQAATAVSFLGSSVEAVSSKIGLVKGAADFSYELPGQAKSVKIEILGKDDKLVRRETGALTAGKHSFHWDGEDEDGKSVADGAYTVKITALDADGKAIPTTTTASGRVDGVQIKDGEIILGIGSLELPFSDVISVRQAETQASNEEDETA